MQALTEIMFRIVNAEINLSDLLRSTPAAAAAVSSLNLSQS